MDFVGNRRHEGVQKGGGGHAIGFGDQLDEGEFARAVDGDIEMQLAFGGLHFGDVDVEITDRIGLELLLRRLVAFDVRQAADPVSLKTAVQA